MTHKLYEVLGVSQKCSSEDIKKAYKKMAIIHHPDKGGDVDKFKEIGNAYSVLSDNQKRNAYDQLGDENYARHESGGGGGSPFDANNIFEQFFGGNGHPFFNMEQPRRKCRDVQHVIQISNKEAYFGTRKNLKITINKKCMDCIDLCVKCQGQGQINELQRMGPFTTMNSRTCDRCRGMGQCVKGKDTCLKCNGRGDYSDEKLIELNIPMGAETGTRIVFEGYGEQPQVPNTQPGDLIFEILVALDTTFERSGINLVYKPTISFVQSIVGTTITVPLYDEQYVFDTAATFGVIVPNKDYVIKHKGMKRDKEIGALILRFTIVYPSSPLSDECKNELKRVFEKHHFD